jgi:Uma2 family endonuclease
MADAARKLMTVDEFHLWCEHQDDRYELVDGVAVLLRGMAGASDPHDAIVVNLIGTLFNQLAGTPCRPSTADKVLRTAINCVRRPDVTIECSPVTPKTFELRNPVAVFESWPTWRVRSCSFAPCNSLALHTRPEQRAARRDNPLVDPGPSDLAR